MTLPNSTLAHEAAIRDLAGKFSEVAGGQPLALSVGAAALFIVAQTDHADSTALNAYVRKKLLAVSELYLSHTTQGVVDDEELAKAFEGTNFGVGHGEYRRLLERSVLKKAVGYHCGHTITTIMKELGLIGKNETVTKKGQRFLQWAFHDQMTEGA